MNGYGIIKSGSNTSCCQQVDYFHPGSIAAMICSNLLVLVVTLPLNVLVLWLIRSGAGTGVKSEFFLLNLCVCEICVSFTSVPNILSTLSLGKGRVTQLNTVMSFLFTLNGTGCPFFQCCICVERYLAVVHPVTFLKLKPLRYRMTFSALLWILIFGMGTLYMFLPFRWIFYAILPQYVLMFTVTVGSSVSVLRTLRRPRPGEKLSMSESKANSMKKKAFVLILVILVFMVLTYGPVLVFIFLYESLTVSQQVNGINMFSYLLVFGGFVQPFIYLHRVGKLSLIKRLRCYCNK